MTSPDARLDALLGTLRQAVDCVCFSVLVGAEDQTFVLDLGERRHRSLRLANRALTFEQRTFEGSFGFLVECMWRLDGPTGMTAVRFGPPLTEPPPPEHPLKILESRRLLAVEALHRGWELSISFDGDYVLHVFSTSIDPRERRAINWSFWHPEGCLTMLSGGRVEVTQADGSRDSDGDGDAGSDAFQRGPKPDDDLVEAWKRRWEARRSREPRDPRDPRDPKER